ncbi:MAG: 50S ribosomal protein L34 [Planctomycetota bacterium]|nr:50S ribosomal protein L34 [Planctomycetota bacterium]
MKIRIRKSNTKRAKRVGFRAKMKTIGGRRMIRERRRRGRALP